MNYLIVMPQVTKVKTQQYGFPIGIAYVSASLKASGRSVTTLNLNYKDASIADLLKEKICNNNIDVLATGGLTSQYSQIREIIDAAQAIKPEMTIVVGGGIITSDPLPAMEALEIADYGVVGEGEITICELAEALESGRTIDSVDGLVYKKGEELLLTKPRSEIKDLDSLPLPDYDGFEFAELVNKNVSEVYGLSKGGGTAPVSFARSCPFNCTFCFHSSGSTYRQRSLDNIFQEIDLLVEKYQVKNLAVSDELFAYDLERVEEFCQRIKQYNMKFFISLRVDKVNRELLQTLRDSGCIGIAYGIESADDRILKSMRKGTTVAQIEKALALTAEMGIVTTGGFIFGDLEETYETAMNTINWWREHPEYTLVMNWIMVFPGSYLYKVACERGIIKDRVQYIRNHCPFINVSKLSDSEYRKIVTLIDSLAFNRVDFLSEVTVLPIAESNKADVCGKCPNCQQESVFTSVDIFKPTTNMTCSHCHKSLNLLIADYIDETFENNIAQLLQNSKIAIWPITNAVANMIKKAPVLLNEKVYLVDSSPYKQENDFMGKITKNPDIIKMREIEVVILATVSPHVAQMILGLIKQNYPSVKHVIYAGELINPEFEPK